MPVPQRFDYSLVVIQFDTRKCDPSSFVLSQDCFCLFGVFCGSIQILGLCFLLLWKTSSES